MLRSIHQRFVDWRREGRIRALRIDFTAAYESGCKQAIRRAAHALFAECDARSPGQVARMERALLDRMDPHARAVFERAKGV
jgi:hypothetical protein